MLPLLTPEEMVAADQATISAGVSAEVLMERAGRAVARATIRLAGGRYGKRIALVCGRGNNGGDGFVAARMLARRGASVAVLLVQGPPREGPALSHFRALEENGIPVVAFASARLEAADVIVDAIFGTGFSGAPEGVVLEAIEAINASSASVLAVDIPSGVDGGTGWCPGAAVAADETLAIEAQKIGVASGPGSVSAGRVEIAPIGISLPSPKAWLVEDDDVRRALPNRPASAHKGSTGAVAVMAGSVAMAGAAVLTCRAADRAGAGYVRLGSLTPVKDVLSVRLPEVLATDLGEAWSVDAVRRFTEQIDRSDALVIGPGMGTGGGERSAVVEALGSSDRPIVLDADGLNNIAGVSAPFSGRDGGTVMTPHPGEMGRLLGEEVREIQRDRVAAARRAAERFGCVVLLKGPRTVIADPSGKVVLDPSGTAALATAGSGDVLAGVIAAYLAAGTDPFKAAWLGAFIHGRAGGVAGKVAAAGVVAWDIAEALPAARASVLDPQG